MTEDQIEMVIAEQLADSNGASDAPRWEQAVGCLTQAATLERFHKRLAERGHVAPEALAAIRARKKYLGLE